VTCVFPDLTWRGESPFRDKETIDLPRIGKKQLPLLDLAH
jgi:hypothetical protein